MSAPPKSPATIWWKRLTTIRTDLKPKRVAIAFASSYSKPPVGF
jgi:hypothetical protein